MEGSGRTREECKDHSLLSPGAHPGGHVKQERAGIAADRPEYCRMQLRKIAIKFSGKCFQEFCRPTISSHCLSELTES